ncbi:MAG: hypothetical protein RIL09_02800, partial [Alphaproteobacteria bacterium]
RRESAATRIRIVRLVATLLAAALLVSPSPASADQTDDRLPALFESLRTAASAAEAMDVEAEIWRIWSDSGDAAVNQLYWRAMEDMNQSNFMRARDRFTDTTLALPGFAEGWNKRAHAKFWQRDLGGALADINHTLKLEPRHFGAWGLLAAINIDLNRPQEALAALDRMLALHPFVPGAAERAAELRQGLSAPP